MPLPVPQPSSGTCPICGRDVLLNPDGTLSLHAARCSGSDQPPATPVGPVLGPV